MWTEEQRGILTINVRGETKKLDPMPLYRRYRAGLQRVTEEAFRKSFQDMMRGSESPGEAMIVMPVIREVFGWKSFEEDAEHGYTEEEMLVAFTQFLEWLITSKKKEESLLSSAGPAGDSAESPVTPSTAPSSFAEGLSSPAEPGKLAAA